MTKREALHKWLLKHGDWVYVNEIPRDVMPGNIPNLQGALRDLCNSGRADFRIVGKYQYRGKEAPTPRTGPKEK